MGKGLNSCFIGTLPKHIVPTMRSYYLPMGSVISAGMKGTHHSQFYDK